MTLQDRLMEDLKTAMRQRDPVRRSVLRMLRSAIHYEEIAVGHPLDDEGVLTIVSRQMRQRRESIAAFEQGKRLDMAANEKAELEVLRAYQPEQMAREELLRIVQAAIEEVGAQAPGDRGKVMKLLMPQLKGRVDGSDVNAAVQELLRQNADG